MSTDLVEHLLPLHEVSIIAGASGAGKTSIIMQLFHALQTGTPFFGMASKPGLKIGYIASDRGGDSLSYWANIMDVDMTQIPTISLIKDDTVNLNHLEKNPMNLLISLIKRLLPCDLLVIDPMIIFFGCDTKSYTANAQRLIYLNRVAHLHHVTILGTHHAVKARTDFGYRRPQDRISGTGAFLGYSSTQIFLDTPEESGTDHHTLHIVSHTAPPREIPLVRDDRGIFIYHEAKSEEVQIAEHILSAIPTTSSISTAELILKLGSAIPKRTVELYLSRLKRDGLVSQPAHGRYSHPPTSEAA